MTNYCKPCRIKNCTNICKDGGTICRMHHSRWNRNKSYDYISPKWTVLKRGQPCLTTSGYFRVWVDGKRILQHVHIMEEFLGRKLKNGERVHHINGIRTDNRIENLKLFKNNSEHMKEGHENIWDKRKDKDRRIDWSKYTNKIPQKITNKNKKIEGICIVEGCTKDIKSRGLCGTHSVSYFRWKIKIKK